MSLSTDGLAEGHPKLNLIEPGTPGWQSDISPTYANMTHVHVYSYFKILITYQLVHLLLMRTVKSRTPKSLTIIQIVLIALERTDLEHFKIGMRGENLAPTTLQGVLFCIVGRKQLSHKVKRLG